MDSVSTVYEVDKQRKLCSCGFWQKSGVPCPHACKCILQKAENIDDFVHKMRTISQYRDTYGPGMNTLPKEFPWMSHVSAVLLLPPRANATIVEDTPYRIPHTKQISPRSATSLAAGQNFLRLPSSSSDEDSIRIFMVDNPYFSSGSVTCGNRIFNSL
ncbi:hypothetical protein CISIN_1g047281mg [Citrus sinensis]|uniref:SWIM-type domain-containing protein n=1 Tax=Citrus sinensis TaxID=2711 RepID=A0A067DE29_CITSI|nr:hypothetical protein CISIN_1g047281mg [Citrus sinensis]